MVLILSVVHPADSGHPLLGDTCPLISGISMSSFGLRDIHTNTWHLCPQWIVKQEFGNNQALYGIKTPPLGLLQKHYSPASTSGDRACVTCHRWGWMEVWVTCSRRQEMIHWFRGVENNRYIESETKTCKENIHISLQLSLERIKGAVCLLYVKIQSHWRTYFE